MASTEVKDYLMLIPMLKSMAAVEMHTSYDAEADTLYVSFGPPRAATDSEMTDEDMIVRYEGDQVIGVTILHASSWGG